MSSLLFIAASAQALYDKCLENRKKTEDELAARYLKPLGTKGRPPA